MASYFYVILLSICGCFAATAAAVNDPLSIQEACGRRNPSPQHFSAAPSSDATSPDLTTAALSITARNLSTAQSLFKSILSSPTYNSTTAVSLALHSCVDFFLLSTRRISASITIAKKYHENDDYEFNLPPSAASDIRAWVGAALLYTYDCWLGLKRVEKTSQVDSSIIYVEDMMPRMTTLLSAIATYQNFGDDWDKYAVLPNPTERDGCWQPNGMVMNDVTSMSDKVETNKRDGTRSGPTFVTVCKDEGSCRFKSVQAAVDAAPVNATSGWYVVHIKKGVYEENVRVPFDKMNMEFVGDGMGKTVITGRLNADSNPNMTIYNAATVCVEGDGFRARKLTIANTAGPNAQQAVAYRCDSDFSFLEDVEFLGHQHTLYAYGLRQYYHRCRIVGTIDFVFGNSATIFDSCNIVVRPHVPLYTGNGGFYTVNAHGRTYPGQPTGFVFRNCVINGSDEYYSYYRQNPAKHKCYLGRVWKSYSRTVFINSYMAEIIVPEGWLPGKDICALETVFFGEYNNIGPGSNRSRRVSWSNEIPEEHVGIYSNQNFIQGDRWIPTYQ